MKYKIGDEFFDKSNNSVGTIINIFERDNCPYKMSWSGSETTISAETENSIDAHYEYIYIERRERDMATKYRDGVICAHIQLSTNEYLDEQSRTSAAMTAQAMIAFNEMIDRRWQK